MWYLVGKYVVMTGSRSEEPGKWFADWVILDEQEDGSLMPIEHGRDDSANEQPMAAAELAAPLGVDAARRLQGDMSLPFSPYNVKIAR